MVTIAPTEMKMSTTNQNTLNAIHLTLVNGIRAGKSKAARKWLADRGLSIELTHAGFSSGQMHHRQSEEMLVRLMLVDFIKLSTAPTNTGKNGYTSFANLVDILNLLILVLEQIILFHFDHKKHNSIEQVIYFLM